MEAGCRRRRGLQLRFDFAALLFKLADLILDRGAGHAGLDGLDELAQVALDAGEFRFVPRFLCILPCGEAGEIPLKLGDESYE